MLGLWGTSSTSTSIGELLEKSSIDEIKRFRTQFAEKAKEELPTKRKVIPTVNQSSSVPLGAFRKE